MDLKSFAARLRTRRQELGLSKAKVARRYGHDPAAIAFYEGGISRPQMFNVDALADGYSLPRNDVRQLVGYPLLPKQALLSLRASQTSRTAFTASMEKSRTP